MSKDGTIKSRITTGMAGVALIAFIGGLAGYGAVGATGSTRIIAIAALLVCIAIAAYLAAAMSGRIAAPIEELAQAAQALSTGDLTVKIAHEGNDALGRLAASLRDLMAGPIGEGRSVKEGIKVPMFLCDRKGIITHISEELAPIVSGLTNRSAADVAGKLSVGEALPDTGGVLKKSVERCMADNEQIKAVAVFQIKGKEMDISFSIAPMRDQSGKVSGALAIGADMTQLNEQRKEMAKGQESMQNVGNEINELAQRVASASEELSASADEQARGAQQQKMQSDAVATAMEEMTSTVMEVAQNASSTSEAADAASQAAQNGVSQVREAVTGINQVAESAAKLGQVLSDLDGQAAEIGRIIGVINDIADQTNLLALNAAIEAARAGEAGRGFAVVADEVRKLAEKTMTATKEVEVSIRRIQDGSQHAVTSMRETEAQVAAGTESTNKAGKALEKIMESIQGMTMQVAQIATAAEEQSAAAEEINTSIVDIAQVASESDEGATQTAQATRELAELSQKLLSLSLSFSSTKVDKSRLRQSKGEMKGVLPKLMQAFIQETYGKDVYSGMQEELGNPVFLPTESYPDQVLKQMSDYVTAKTGKKTREVFIALGEFTINQFYKMYKRYFKAKDLKEFYLTMNDTHARLTKDFPGIHPPKFTYEDKGDTLVMTYISKRGYHDYFEGILRGAAKFFGKKPDIKIEKLDAERARATVAFPAGTYKAKALV